MEKERHGSAVPLENGQNGLLLDDLLSGLLGGHLSTDLGSDVPYKLKGGPGTQDEYCGNQDTQDLQAHDGAGGLDSSGAFVADPCQTVQSAALTDGLTQTAGQIEGAVDRALRITP